MVVTPFYAGLLALWFAVLSLRVIRERRDGLSFGDGGRTDMQRKIRAHANFAEYVPLSLLMLGLLESGGGAPLWALHGLGATLLLGRLLHGYALSFTTSFPPGRVGGTILTVSVVITSACLCVWQGLRSLSA